MTGCVRVVTKAGTALATALFPAAFIPVDSAQFQRHCLGALETGRTTPNLQLGLQNRIIHIGAPHGI
jgi:hypothetical protein